MSDSKSDKAAEYAEFIAGEHRKKEEEIKRRAEQQAEIDQFIGESRQKSKEAKQKRAADNVVKLRQRKESGSAGSGADFDLDDLKLDSGKTKSAESGSATPIQYGLEWMNQRHAVIHNQGGKFVVADIDGREVQTFLQEDFCKRYANRFVDGGRRSQTVAEWWLTQGGRNAYDQLVLRPDTLERTVWVDGKRCLNLWRGFSVKPVKGDWGRMKEHVYEVLAAGDQGGGDYIMRWAAFGVQRPGERSEQALGFRGEEGIGKGTFANPYLGLFGEHGFRVQSANELTGEYNDHFRDRVMILADEAIWGGDRVAENKLKGYITESTYSLHAKFRGRINWPNCLSFLITGNANWIVPAGPKSRRYTVFEPAETHRGDQAYFDAILNELQGGGRSAMLYDLLDLPLGEWHPRVGYKTVALQDQKRHSLEPAWKAMEMVLQEGALPGASGPLNAASLAAIKNRLVEAVPFLKTRSEAEIKDMLKFLGGAARRDSTGYARLWYFPPLAECRKRWEEKFGSWRWEPVKDWGIDASTDSLSDILATRAADIATPAWVAPAEDQQNAPEAPEGRGAMSIAEYEELLARERMKNRD